MKYLQFLEKYPDWILLSHCTDWRMNNYRQSAELSNTTINAILQSGIKSYAEVHQNCTNHKKCHCTINKHGVFGMESSCNFKKSKAHYVYGVVPYSLDLKDIIDSRLGEKCNFCLFAAHKEEFCYDHAATTPNFPMAMSRNKMTISSYMQAMKSHQYHDHVKLFNRKAEYIQVDEILVSRIVAFARAEKIFASENLQKADLMYFKKYLEYALGPCVFFPVGNGDNVLMEYCNNHSVIPSIRRILKAPNISPIINHSNTGNKYIIRVVFDKELVFGNKKIEQTIENFFAVFENLDQLIIVVKKAIELGVHKDYETWKKNWQDNESVGDFAENAVKYIEQHIDFALQALCIKKEITIEGAQCLQLQSNHKMA